MNNKKLSVFLIVLMIVLGISFILIPSSVTKTKQVSKDEYKNIIYDEVKKEKNLKTKEEQDKEYEQQMKIYEKNKQEEEAKEQIKQHQDELQQQQNENLLKNNE